MANGQTNSDHDRLIRVETKVNVMCTTINEVQSDIRDMRTDLKNASIKTSDDCVICREQIHNNINKKVGWGNFKWIIGGLAGFILASLVFMISFMYDNRVKYMKTNSLLNDHIAFSELVYEDVTGKKWGIAARKELKEALEKVEKSRENTQPPN